MAKNPKNDPYSIDPERLRSMLRRYDSILTARARIDGPTVRHLEFDNASKLITAALTLLSQVHTAGAYKAVRHMVGMVQGILYCKGVYSFDAMINDHNRGD